MLTGPLLGNMENFMLVLCLAFKDLAKTRKVLFHQEQTLFVHQYSSFRAPTILNPTRKTRGLLKVILCMWLPTWYLFLHTMRQDRVVRSSTSFESKEILSPCSVTGLEQVI